MKKFTYKLVVMLVLFIHAISQAQTGEKTKFNLYYLNASTYKFKGDYGLKELGLNAITNKNWGFSMSYHAKVIRDLDAKLIDRQSVSLRWNKLFETNTPLLRYGFELGPIVNQSVLYRYKFNENTNTTTVENTKYNSAGFFIRAKAELPIFKNLGLQLGTTVIVDKVATGLSADLIFCFGKVRNSMNEKINLSQFLLN